VLIVSWILLLVVLLLSKVSVGHSTTTSISSLIVVAGALVMFRVLPVVLLLLLLIILLVALVTQLLIVGRDSFTIGLCDSRDKAFEALGAKLLELLELTLTLSGIGDLASGASGTGCIILTLFFVLFGCHSCGSSLFFLLNV
jgi:hypothetical protein